MDIDWGLALEILKISVAVIVGAWIRIRFERRAHLVVYLGHIADFSLKDQQILTHSFILRNTGKLAANNVRITHKFLPSHFEIKPPRQYELEAIADGGQDILFRKMVPGEEVSISYLYLKSESPGSPEDVHRGISCDEGFAKVLNVLPTRQWPKWWLRLSSVLTIIGMAASVYLLIELGEWIVKLIQAVG